MTQRSSAEAVAMANRQRVQVWYSGHVQGVGFRQRTRTLAADFQIAGEVRNLSDGRVELLAEGCQSELMGFLQAIEEALGGYIRGSHCEWAEAVGDRVGFCVTPDRFVG